MNPASAVRNFCKTAQCPSSETLLRYRRCRMPVTDRFRIERHLDNCDFCSAELQLLGRYRNEVQQSPAAELPSTLRFFAELFLRNPAPTWPRISELTNGSRLSH